MHTCVSAAEKSIHSEHYDRENCDGRVRVDWDREMEKAKELGRRRDQ